MHDVNLIPLARRASEATVPYKFKLALFSAIVLIRNDHTREIVDRLLARRIAFEFHVGLIAVIRVTKALIAIIIDNIVAASIFEIVWFDHVDLTA